MCVQKDKGSTLVVTVAIEACPDTEVARRYIYMYIYTHTHMYVYIYMCVHAHVYIYTCMLVAVAGHTVDWSAGSRRVARNQRI